MIIECHSWLSIHKVALGDWIMSEYASDELMRGLIVSNRITSLSVPQTRRRQKVRPEEVESSSPS